MVEDNFYRVDLHLLIEAEDANDAEEQVYDLVDVAGVEGIVIEFVSEED